MKLIYYGSARDLSHEGKKYKAHALRCHKYYSFQAQKGPNSDDVGQESDNQILRFSHFKRALIRMPLDKRQSEVMLVTPRAVALPKKLRHQPLILQD